MARAKSAKPEVVIYHNPACTTSRKVLGMIREAGVEPRVIEYLKTPPTRPELLDLLRAHGHDAARTAAPARHAVRGAWASTTRQSPTTT